MSPTPAGVRLILQNVLQGQSRINAELAVLPRYRVLASELLVNVRRTRPRSVVRSESTWSPSSGPAAGQVLTGHAGPVNAVAVGALPNGTPIIVSGGADGTSGLGGWPTAPRSFLRWTYPNRCSMSPFTAMSSHVTTETVGATMLDPVQGVVSGCDS